MAGMMLESYSKVLEVLFLPLPENGESDHVSFTSRRRAQGNLFMGMLGDLQIAMEPG
jgi:hypothetical protein